MSSSIKAAGSNHSAVFRKGHTLQIAVIGLGLIGGSLAKAAQRAGHQVAFVDKLYTAPLDGLTPLELPAGLGACDLILIALPPAAVVPWIERYQAAFKTGALVVDATGVKATICQALRPFAFQERWTFIGGHPMAGKETSGFAHATADLFKGASMILTPYPTCGRLPLDRLTAFFAELGFARTLITTPEHHDRMIALTSQLAHVVSSAYARDPLALEHAGYSAGSFHDMTRVARLDPAIWTDLLLANRAALLETLDGFMARLGEYRTALATADATLLEGLLAAGRAARLAEANEPEA